MISSTPKAPYYAVIFTSIKTQSDAGYDLMSNKMVELAKTQPGFLGVESAREGDGIGITVSHWQDVESITNLKKNTEHQKVQRMGQEKWYEHFKVRICKVERDYEM